MAVPTNPQTRFVSQPGPHHRLEQKVSKYKDAPLAVLIKQEAHTTVVGQQTNTTTHREDDYHSSRDSQDERPKYGDNDALPLGTKEHPIIFFDGDCVMCNGFVDVLLQIDSKGLFYLSPLQGETARQCLPPLSHNREEWSIYYLDTTALSTPSGDGDGDGDGNGSVPLYSQSDAVIQICRRLGGIWSLAALGNGIPSFIRDGVYRMVARNRYRLFGQRSTCRMPTEAERSRFLP